MKVNRVVVSRGVDEPDAHAVALRCPDRGTGNAVVVGPSRKEHSGRDLDLPVDCEELVFTHGASGGIFGDLVAGVEVGQDLHRVEAVACVIDAPDGAEPMAPEPPVSTVG